MSRCNFDGWSDVIGEVPWCLSMQTTVRHEAELESDPLWSALYVASDSAREWLRAASPMTNASPLKTRKSCWHRLTAVNKVNVYV